MSDSKEVLHTGIFPITVDGKEYNNANELFSVYTIPDRLVTFGMIDKIYKNPAVNNYQKLLDSNRELTEAIKYLLTKFSADTMSEIEERKRIQQLCK